MALEHTVAVQGTVDIKLRRTIVSAVGLFRYGVFALTTYTRFGATAPVSNHSDCRSHSRTVAAHLDRRAIQEFSRSTAARRTRSVGGASLPCNTLITA